MIFKIETKCLIWGDILKFGDFFHETQVISGEETSKVGRSVHFHEEDGGPNSPPPFRKRGWVGGGKYPRESVFFEGDVRL